MRRTVGLALALSAGVAGTGMAQEPSISARFVVESPKLEARAGGPDAAATLEDSVSSLLVTTGHFHFPYLRWLGDSSAGAVPRLEVAVVQFSTSAGPSTCTRVDLAFRAFVDDGPARSLGDDKLIYPPCGHIPDIIEDLERDLGDSIRAHFENQDFRRKLQEVLLSRVALADRFMLDLVKRNVVVPIRWKALQADSAASELQLKFVVHRPEQGEELNGLARLKGPAEIMPADTTGRPEIGAWLGFARWIPSEFTITDLMTLESNIVPALDSLRSRGALANTGAFMSSYAPVTGGGLADCLEDCGGGG